MCLELLYLNKGLFSQLPRRLDDQSLWGVVHFFPLVDLQINLHKHTLQPNLKDKAG